MLGIIPADAGSTDDFSRALDPPEDHPRGCGEHTLRSLWVSSSIGSSPRMRGAHTGQYAPTDDTRIIPADAGSTGFRAILFRPDPDHPRGCGEHNHDYPDAAVREGSSPRMRGARWRDSPCSLPPRIIPADAGSTKNRDTPGGLQRDHPRGCGEHSSMMICVYAQLGSSPRMRGAPCCPGGDSQAQGIIPADAGSTVLQDIYDHDCRDHPRGCGEHTASPVDICSPEGSSPRMRGALAGRLGLIRRSRIIPADAGSTPVRMWTADPDEDHPRGCGEH